AETGKRGSEREGFHPETEPTCRASSRPSHLGSPSANGAGSAAAAQDGFATKTVLAVELPRFRVRAKLLFSCVREVCVSTFKAIVIEKDDGGQKVALTDFDEANLMEGDVTVRVEWSTVNYKDGLAITGKAPVVRRFPMIAGIDLAGTVESSSHPEW